MEKEIKCPECGSEEIRRAGKPRGKQQYQCKECERKFITELNYSKEFKQKAIAIFYEGNSGRAVGRIMGINKSTVYNWIKELDEEIESSKLEEEENKTEGKETDDAQTVDIIEMDELFSYIKEKKHSLLDDACDEKTAANRWF